MSLERAREAAPSHGGRGVDEHQQRTAAITDRNAVHATDLMTIHLTRTAERLKDAVELPAC